MAKFSVVLTDPAHVAGLTAARLAHNAKLPKDGLPLFSDDEFVQFMVERVAEKYAQELPKANDQGDKGSSPSSANTLESRLAAGLAAQLLPEEGQG
jgi:hypothetical protein